MDPRCLALIPSSSSYALIRFVFTTVIFESPFDVVIATILPSSQVGPSNGAISAIDIKANHIIPFLLSKIVVLATAAPSTTSIAVESGVDVAHVGGDQPSREGVSYSGAPVVGGDAQGKVLTVQARVTTIEGDQDVGKEQIERRGDDCGDEEDLVVASALLSLSLSPSSLNACATLLNTNPPERRL